MLENGLQWLILSVQIHATVTHFKRQTHLEITRVY